MTKYTAIATDQDGNKKLVEMDYPTKTAFIQDLRANGYKVSNKNVHTSEKFNRVVNETNGNPWDWE